jgi:Prokaryotic N-terminal methylation motif
MRRARGREAAKHSTLACSDDSGVTFVEMLVAIVLLGTVVLAVITALQVTLIGSRVERDHAKVHQWLQASVGILQSDATAFGDCVTPNQTNLDTIINNYTAAVRTGAAVPEGFASSNQLSVVSVEVWDGNEWLDFLSQTDCLDNNLLRQQLVAVQATNNDGSISEIVEVVKHD